MPDRRMLLSSVAGLGLIAAWKWLGFSGPVQAAGKFEIEKTPEEWKRALTPEQYYILREHGTERPYSSPLNNEHRKGIFSCAGCDLPLYSSDTKFESGTGWPSFYDHLPDAIGTSVDRTLRPYRGALPPLRRSSRPRFRGRAQADRPALLHGWPCPQVRTGEPHAVLTVAAILAALGNCAPVLVPGRFI